MLRHIAFIMDGNRRWAQKKGLPPWYGHQEGIQTIYRVIEFCLKHSISYLSLYTFAIQNFKRSPIEIDYIFLQYRNMQNASLLFYLINK